MADPLDDELTKAYQDQALEAELDAAYKDQTKSGHSFWEGMAHQALDAATLHASKHLKSDTTLARDAKFAKENPWWSTGAQAAGFIAPMLTPAGWVARGAAAAPGVARLVSWALPFANFNRAVAPGAGLRTIAHQSGLGTLKAGAMMRFNDPVKEPATEATDELPGVANFGKRLGNAADLPSMAWDYGLGGAGGVAGNKIGSAVGSTVQKLVDQVPRFSFNRGRAGNGFYDWTRGGAQRAHDALSGDLRPGQSLEEAATHGMLGEFSILQPSSRTRTGYSHAPAPHAYKYHIAQRYVEHIDAGMTPTQARAQVAADILADPQTIARFNLRGRGRAPAASTIQGHVRRVADAMDNAGQFPTTLQERVALSQGGTTAGGKPTYGAAPNSYSAVDEMLTSPGSKDPGSARAQATNWVTQRQQGMHERVKNFLDENLGEGDVHQALAAHEARRAAAYDTYDPAIAAWRADPDAPDALEHAVAGAIRNWRQRSDPALTVTRDVDDAISRAFERRVQGIADDVEVPTMNIGRDGKPITRVEPGKTPPAEIRVPNQLEAFIAQRSNFAREAEKVRISDPSLYRVMKQFQKEHLDPAVRPLAPDWARSNDLAADMHAMRRAFTEGESFPLGATTKQAERLRAYRRMTPDQQALFRAGLNAQIQKRLAGKTGTGDQHTFFSKHEVGDTLRAIMGDDAANELLRQLQAVAAASKTNKIFAQSATHGREAEERANRSILNLIQSIGGAIAHPWHSLGEIAKWGGEKMATEAQRARNDRALRILTANTDDLPNYFRQIADVTDSSRNHLPAVTQRIDELMRRLGTMTGVAGAKRQDESVY
jgi:hypothetical protein